MKQAPLLVAVFVLLVSLTSCSSGDDGSAVANPGADKGPEDESATSATKPPLNADAETPLDAPAPAPTPKATTPPSENTPLDAPAPAPSENNPAVTAPSAPAEKPPSSDLAAPYTNLCSACS
jgi:outer membrane biosynthesis protein TonB